MNFQDFVHKSSKGIFLFIVILMALSLVLWGYMGPSDTADRETDAGVLFDQIPISRAVYSRQLQRARLSAIWKQYMTFRQFLQPPKQDQIIKQAWENIILLNEAKTLNIATSDPEVAEMIERMIYAIGRGQLQPSPEALHLVAERVFQTDKGTFQDWVADYVVIEKFLDLVTEGEFAEQGRIYDEAFKENRWVKVGYTGVDPQDVRKDLRSISPEEIAAYYEKNKNKFKVPGKIQVAYLMVEFDALKKGVPDATEEEMRKYYTDNERLYEKKAEHKHEEGEEEPRESEKQGPKEYKPFADVKGEIAEKLKFEKAREEAAGIMTRVDVEMGSFFKDNAYPDTVFDTLKEKFKAQNIELVHDVTAPFNKNGVEEIESTLGTGTQMETWGFAPGRKAGDVSKNLETSKGRVLLRLQKLSEPYEAGITEPVRRRIETELKKEQLAKHAKQIANNIAQQINTRGVEAAKRKYGFEWRLTPYFKAGTRPPGIDNDDLLSIVNRQISRNQLHAGKADVVGGEVMAGSKKSDWAYVLYLADETLMPPEKPEESVKNARSRMNREAQGNRRRKYVEELVNAAKVQDKINKKDGSKAPPAPEEEMP